MQSTVFVAVHLDNLPRITPGEIDPVSLLERVTSLEIAMGNVQQCVTRHDSALSAVSRPATTNLLAQQLQDLHVAMPLIAPLAHESLPGQAVPTTVNTPGVTHSADGQTWSHLVAAIATDPPDDGFQVPSYHRKKTAQLKGAEPAPKKRRKVDVFYGKKNSSAIKCAPKKLELFVFNVDCSTDENCIKEFLKEEQVKVIEMECVSHKEAWTKSSRVLVTADDPVCTLDCDFWPLGIGCRRFFKKRQRTDQ